MIGYVTGPRAGRAEPERDIERACERSGWQLVDVVRDREDGSILERPALTGALERIVAGQSARARRQRRQAAEPLGGLREVRPVVPRRGGRADRARPRARHLDPRGQPCRQFADHVERLGRRVDRQQDAPQPGGHPPQRRHGPARLAISERPEVLERIAGMHEADMAPQEIADQLNDEGVPTLFGTEKWWPSSDPDRAALLARGVRGQARAAAVTGEERDCLIQPVGSPRHRHPRGHGLAPGEGGRHLPDVAGPVAAPTRVGLPRRPGARPTRWTCAGGWRRTGWRPRSATRRRPASLRARSPTCT